MTTATRTNPLAYLTNQLDEIKAKGTHFKLRVLDDEQAAVCTFDGKKVINLASNNYLGLTTHPKLREAALEATRKYGVGSGAVRTIAGTMKIHMELEEKIARFKNVEACVVFQSGFTSSLRLSCTTTVPATKSPTRRFWRFNIMVTTPTRYTPGRESMARSRLRPITS